MYMIPAAVCVLGFAKILSPKELITNIASDTSWLYVYGYPYYLPSKYRNTGSNDINCGFGSFGRRNGSEKSDGSMYDFWFLCILFPEWKCNMRVRIQPWKL